jgi:archaellin
MCLKKFIKSKKSLYKYENKISNEDIIYFESIEYNKLINQIENYFNQIYNGQFKIIGNNVSKNNKTYYILMNDDRTHKIKLEYKLSKYNDFYKIKIYLDIIHLYSI